MLSTLALIASSRADGNTGKVVARIAAALRIEVVDLATVRMSAYDYDHKNRTDDFEPLMAKVLRHQQIIFASPVYWYAVTPPMKIFFDRLNDFLELADLRPQGRQIRGLRAYVVATSGNAEISPAFLSMLTESFAYLGMSYAGLLHINCDGGYAPEKSAVDIQDFVTLVRNAK
jgi:multimeric flavodoxin WrbA